jgi:nicotinamidase/pyrazinamidase
MNILPTDALIVVDPQNDFCPGGKLAVEGGDEIMQGISELSSAFWVAGSPIVLTQDYHNPGHKSFASSHPGAEPFSMIEMPYGPQVLWPDHCIGGSYGADFHDRILEETFVLANLVIRKGMNPEIDSYSAFYENDKTTKTGLSGFLRDRGVKRVIVVGLAYDYCVGYTALDAVREGFETFVIKSLTRAIALNSATDMTIAMATAGVTINEDETV